MAAENLNLFASLQIPQINAIVLAAAYNPLKISSHLALVCRALAATRLATGDRKIGKDTVFLVCVPDVCLETLALVVIP